MPSTCLNTTRYESDEDLRAYLANNATQVRRIYYQNYPVKGHPVQAQSRTTHRGLPALLDLPEGPLDGLHQQ